MNHTIEERVEAIEERLGLGAFAPPLRAIIRSGELIVGKQYRIVEIARWDPNPDLPVGTIVTCVDWVPINGKYKIHYRQFPSAVGPDWMASSGAYEWSATRVVAVELVED